MFFHVLLPLIRLMFTSDRPVAKVAGFALGATTALMGKEAAMACTEAVETVIGEHYDEYVFHPSQSQSIPCLHCASVYSQLKEFEPLTNAHPSLPLLREIITEFRDDELEHLDIAVANDSQKAPAHALLSTVVGAGCMVAIELCKRI